MPKDGASQVAYCAEYDSQEDEEVASTRRHATGTSVPEQANITAKRTTDTQGSASTSPRQNSRDLASDSGYSSRTHGTSASAESGKSATALPSTTMDAKPTATVTAGGSPQASASASKPALSRASSKSSHRVRKCAEPDCAKCKRGRMLKQAAAESSQKAPSQAEPQPDERARSTEKRPPTPAATQPQARPPLRSASTSRARPRSMYDAPREPQSAGAGPPLSYWNPARYPYYAQGYMTGAGNFMVTDRPGLPHRATDGTMPSARTPANAVGTPFVTYDPGATERLSARRPAKKMHPAVGYEHGVVDDEDEDEDETADSEEYDSPEDQYRRMLRERQNELEAFEARRRAEALQREEDARRMPPPPPPPQPAPSASIPPLYSMRTYDAAATNITYGDRNNGYDDAAQNAARGLDFVTGGPSRPRRTSMASSGKGTSTSQPMPGNHRVTIQDPLAARRQSFFGGEDINELVAKHFETMRLGDDAALQAHALRRKAGGSDFKYAGLDMLPFGSLARDERPTRYDKLSEEALAYQRFTDRLGPSEPANLSARHVRRYAGLLSEDEEPRSPVRTNMLNDGGARMTPRRQAKAVPSDRMSAQDGEVRMRFDFNNELELEFEGRRLAIAPTGDGSMAELVIGSKRDGTSNYGTSKGSTTESRLGRSNSTRTKEPGRRPEREPPTPTRARREDTRSAAAAAAAAADDDDDAQSTTTSDEARRRATRAKRAETLAAAAASAVRRAAEDALPSDSDPSKPVRTHRRSKTHDVRYDPGPASPGGARSKRAVYGRQ